MSENSYVKILIEALTKKSALLEQIMDICVKQEDVIKEKSAMASSDAQAGANANKASSMLVNVMRECSSQKEELSKQVQKLDDGFVSVYDRVSAELVEKKSEYQNEIRLIQSLIKKITDQTASIESKETRINNEIKKSGILSGAASVGKNGSGAYANNLTGSMSKASQAYGNVAGKYAQVMKKSSAQGSLFINEKQ